MNGAPHSAGLSPRPVPTSLRPMLARSAKGPLDDPAYAYEIKWDGMRVLAGVSDSLVSLVTRNGIEAAPRFPELAALRESVAAGRAILDGEVVALRGGRPDFWLLQQRIQATRPERIQALVREAPAAYILFDVLRIEDEWLMDLPWAERRRRLEQLVSERELVQLSPVWPGGAALWATADRLGLEGIMAKRRAGRYHPGVRSPDWLKIKFHNTLDAVVCGWTEGMGERRGLLGALVLGRFEGERLVCIGHVGSGFSALELRKFPELLQPLEMPCMPFPTAPITNGPARWLRPEQVCEVRHQGWSADGRLRAPVFVRWRPDKTARECVA